MTKATTARAFYQQLLDVMLTLELLVSSASPAAGNGFGSGTVNAHAAAALSDIMRERWERRSA